MFRLYITVDENGTIDLDKVSILYQRQIMPYRLYHVLSKGANQDEDEVKEYAKFVGKVCAERMFLFRK